MLGRLGSNCRDKSQWYNDRLRSWHVSILCTPFVFASVSYEVKMHPNVRLTIKAVALDPLRGSLSWVRNLTLWWRSSLADITVATHAPEVTNSKTLNASHPGSWTEFEREKPIIRLTYWGYMGIKTAAAGAGLTRSPGERDDSLTDEGSVRWRHEPWGMINTLQSINLPLCPRCFGRRGSTQMRWEANTGSAQPRVEPERGVGK